MKETLQNYLLAVIQGLTEFLPVSSSGHLYIFQKNFFEIQPDLSLSLVLHLGTVFSVVCYYHKQLPMAFELEFIKKIIVMSLPTGIIGLLLKDYIKYQMVSGLVVVGFMFTAMVLWFLDRKTKGATVNDGIYLSKISYKAAFLMGVMQGGAVLPGVSRSGSTIAVGVFQGVPAGTASFFSFVGSIPVILGASLLELKEASLNSSEIWTLISYGAVAFCVGLLAISLIDRYLIPKSKMRWFSVYLMVMSGLVLISSK